MSLLTALALRRRSVTVLVVLMVLAGGLFTYTNLQVEFFPEIEFPLLIVTTFYPSANPDAVVTDVTKPIEETLSRAVRMVEPTLDTWGIPHWRLEGPDDIGVFAKAAGVNVESQAVIT